MQKGQHVHLSDDCVEAIKEYLANFEGLNRSTFLEACVLYALSEVGDFDDFLDDILEDEEEEEEEEAESEELEEKEE